MIVNSKLFVGGIPLDMDENEFRKLFKDYGTVLAANIVRDKRSNISRCFGFVEMATPQEA